MQTWLLSPPPTSRLPVRSQHAGPPCLARSDQAAKRSTLLKWPRVWRKARQCCSRSAHLLTSFIASGLPNHWASWSRLALYSFLDSVVEAQGTSSSRLHPEGPFLTPYYPTEASLLSSSPPETSLRDILSPLGRELLGQRTYPPRAGCMTEFTAQPCLARSSAWISSSLCVCPTHIQTQKQRHDV